MDKVTRDEIEKDENQLKILQNGVQTGLCLKENDPIHRFRKN